ncbi:hypothetical protein A2866_05680 [Candidatus Roizmanbacteria bacterium RIFCSPHIGHO2_01_FULL_39_8]|uniref:Uncharacterized protein n=3 Tax=Candidatus Roizmaniibacteriota TaxID=1752723 RepID=A0A1F7GN55_9BACT|nr:MAG: hypothetical protein A2866_05680 [Candidatus Roizmanbacteria bacterium RIFCSPHIGHO2_01_FULL_39_8]OGK28437.1 MAG: hypothetical protein A3C28_02330 [Candidatus Roizmanbacteria bacterium RIFCSPHIGHO2_02_FULL_39_9]OGK35561.1 MAG: hypothetical protein A3F60_03995 [Candidatus Roizmanbacteria bacterium RIFCSPHIGHO2_12_FULL_39_8]
MGLQPSYRGEKTKHYAPIGSRFEIPLLAGGLLGLVAIGLYTLVQFAPLIQNFISTALQPGRTP